MFGLIESGEYYKWKKRRKDQRFTPDFLNNLRVLVVGGGSVGKRYLGNLIGLGAGNVAVAEPNAERRAEVREFFGDIPSYETEEAAYAAGNYDAAIIANPPAYHIESAKKAVAAGAHVLIEKSISDKVEGVEDFLKTADAAKRLVGVGYVYRFGDALRHVKSLLDGGALGRVFSAQITFSEYLPNWHPWEPVKETYMARKEHGGSELLDENHTVDFARWFFGDIREVTACVGRLSDLTVDADDFAELTCVHAGGVVTQIHQDALGRKPRKDMWITGEKGSIFWDSYMAANRVELYQGDAGKSEVTFGRMTRNDMFVELLCDFLECVASGKQPMITGWDALKTQKVCAAAEQSSKEGRRLLLN